MIYNQATSSQSTIIHRRHSRKIEGCSSTCDLVSEIVEKSRIVETSVSIENKVVRFKYQVKAQSAKKLHTNQEVNIVSVRGYCGADLLASFNHISLS